MKTNAHFTPPPAAPSNAIGWLTPDQFAFFRDLLAGYSGVYLDATRQRQLEAGLAQRLRAMGETLALYLARLRAPGDRGELQRLAELVVNHETIFFRNGPHFRALREALLGELHDRKPAAAPIRIWSAGCATGEEAYSLAIVALETLGQPLARPVEIWATDLSKAALQGAQAGFYRGRTLQNVPPELLARYFHAKGDGYVVDGNVRALVRFEQLNLLEPFPAFAHGVDLIFCQNVTIYFQLKTCRQLMARFHDCLPAGGMLFLGFSETLWNVFDHFSSREVAGAYVYYKEAFATPPLPARDRQPDPRPLARSPQQAGSVPTPLLVGDSKHVARKHPHPVAAPAPQAPSMLDRGQALLEQGHLDAALEALRHIAPTSADAPRALSLIARAHADRGDLDLAAAEVRRALEIDALNHDAYLLLGIIFERQGQLATAIQQFERARYLCPESAVVSFHLAGAYRQAGRMQKAAQEYRNTLKKLEKHPPGTLLDGVAVGWLRETCHRQIEYLPQTL